MLIYESSLSLKKLIYLALIPFLLFPKTYPVHAQVPPKVQKALLAPETSQETAIQYATEQAKIIGTPITRALWILSHESQNCQNLYGDDGNSRGCWMISSIWNPHVTKQCALSLQCSTAWSLPLIKTNPNLWSTWACRYVWYPDATSTLGPAPKDYKIPKYCL